MINHRTAKPKNKTEYNIETGECQSIQENILKYLCSRGSACTKKKLLPCSLYRKEKLKIAVSELLEKNAIERFESSDKYVYKLSENYL
jgi:hypothetical protein